MVKDTLVHGDLVILRSVPPTLFRDLPEEDQAAIRSVIGKLVTFRGFSHGQAELEFRDVHGDEHTIWVDADRISGIGAGGSAGKDNVIQPGCRCPHGNCTGGVVPEVRL